ncbi:MAG TPA: hypothetical protein VFU46_15075 [Gemmatimonadales bacterium]|nr:hypothetical protein [Gemmatimonadales bacterium]
MRSPLPLLLLSLAALPAAAQSQPGDDRWQLALDDGSYLWDVRLVKLEGDSIHVRRGDSVAVVSVSQVNEFRLIRKSEMQLGTPGGAMAALTGADDEVYDLTPLEFADRVRAVQKIFLYHPPEEAAAGR